MELLQSVTIEFKALLITIVVSLIMLYLLYTMFRDQESKELQKNFDALFLKVYNFQSPYMDMGRKLHKKNVDVNYSFDDKKWLLICRETGTLVNSFGELSALYWTISDMR